MAKIEFKCPICKAKATQERETLIQTLRFIKLSCGHTYTDKTVDRKKGIDNTLNDGRLLYDFQKDGVEFARNSEFRCLIADEMGLGKTVQVVSALKNYPEDLLPALIIVKASLKIQWMKELFNGAGLVSQVLEAKTEPIKHDKIKVFITTYDVLRNATWKDKLDYGTIILDECQQIKNHNSKRTNQVRDLISRRMVTKEETYVKGNDPKIRRIEMIAHNLMEWHGVSKNFTFHIVTNEPKNILGKCKCAPTKDGIIVGRILLNRRHVMIDSEEEIIETILHEIAHAITPGAGHRQIWHDTAKAIGSGGNSAVYKTCDGTVLDKEEKEPAVKHIIATSGTPIKNHAGEYFPILNILRPELFPDQTQFISNWTDAYRTSFGWKVGGIRNPERFKEYTKDFIIRRERKEVLPDLPEIRRSFRYSEMNETLAKEYKATLRNFQDYMLNDKDEDGLESTQHILAYLNKMRHLAGFAKVGSVIDYIEDFIEQEDGKITIFQHHIDVAEVLILKLNELGIKTLRLKSTMDAVERNNVIEEFKASNDIRVLIAPTLACGEGINLQFCSHAIIAEREWNPSNEEQAEGRFSRIGSTADSIEVLYPVAIGSVDEMFAEYVERKRQYVGEAMSGKKSDVTWDQTTIIKDIADKLMSGNTKAWSI